MAAPKVAATPKISALPPAVYVHGGIQDDVTGSIAAVPMRESRSGGSLDVTDRYVNPDGICGGSAPCYTTIQGAIDVSSPGDIIHVQAGSYVENIVVNVSVTIDGAGEGVTIIYPALSAPGTDDGPSMPVGTSHVIVIAADNVTISNLTVDGDNPSLTSGVVRNGADIDARNGIVTNKGSAVTGMLVHHCTVQNIYLRGIYPRDNGSSFHIHHNTVQNVDGGYASIGIFNWGSSGIIEYNSVTQCSDAIAANHSRGTQFLNNIVTQSGSGVHTDNNGDGGGVADVIDGNHVSNGYSNSYGVWVFFPYLNVVLNNNTVTNCDVGLFAWGGAGGVGQFTNNTVDAQNRAGSIGVYATCGPDYWGSWQSNVSASFNTNSVSNTDYGFVVESDEATPFYSVAVTVSSHSASGNTADIYVAGLGPLTYSGLGGNTVIVGNPGRIQDGINLANAGGTVDVAAGTYTENFNVNKHVDIIGAGSGSDPLSNTVVTQTTAGAGDTKIGVAQLTASGVSSADPILLQDLRLEPVGMAGISVGRFTEATGQTVDYVKLDNVHVIGTNVNPSTEQERGLYVDLTSTLRYLDVVDCAFNNLTYGWYFQKQVSADASTVQYVTVDGTTFNHNNHKGVYTEKLSDAAFTGCTVDNNGFDSSVLPSYFQAWSCGIDINLKAGSYANLTFDDCIITNNAIDETKEGVGLTVKARDDGTTYGPFPASVSNVDVLNCTITGNERGLRFGEPGKNNATPTDVTVYHNTFCNNVQHYSGTDGTAYGDLIEMTAAAGLIDAEENYWCTVDMAQIAAKIYGDVDWSPWCNSDFSVCSYTWPVHNVTQGIDYMAIQPAIDDADPGDFIQVDPGTYYEHNITINKSLTINGDPGDGTPGPGTNAPVIDGQDLYVDCFKLVNGVSNVTIQGFEIKNYTAGTGNGEGNAVQAWVASTTNITIADNYMHDLRWNGVLVGNDGATGTHNGWTIARNILDNFGTGTFSFSGYGFELTNTSNGVIEDNIITAGTRQPGCGILVTARRPALVNMILRRNEISGEYDYNGIAIYAWNGDVSNPSLTGLVVENNLLNISGTCNYALSIRDIGGPVSGITVYDNYLVKAGGKGLYKGTAETINASGNWWGDITPAGVPTKIQGTVDYTPWLASAADLSTDPGFQGDFSELWVDDNSPQTGSVGRIQEGVNSVSGSTVNVAAGLYTERVVINDPITLLGATAAVDKNGYTVPGGYAWDTSVESVIDYPDPTGLAGDLSQVVDIRSSDVTFKGFVVQVLNARCNFNGDQLLRVNAGLPGGPGTYIDNVIIENNVLGPNTNISTQDGTCGRMGLYLASPTYPSHYQGITNSHIAGNKIFEVRGNGDNVFVWGAAASYNSVQNADYSGTVIENNDIYGSHRAGIEIAGGVSGLTIHNNRIYGNSSTINGGAPDANLKYGGGIIVIRMGTDKTNPAGMGVDDLTITENEIFDNEKNGVYFGPIASNVTIHENNIHDNGWNGLIVDLNEMYYGGSWPVTNATSNINADYHNTLLDNGLNAAVVSGTPTNGFVLDAELCYWGTLNYYLIEGQTQGPVDFDPWCNSDFSVCGYTHTLPDIQLSMDDPHLGCSATCIDGLLKVQLTVIGIPNLSVVFTLPSEITAILPMPPLVSPPVGEKDPNLLNSYATLTGNQLQIDMGFNSPYSTGDLSKYVAYIPIQYVSGITGTYNITGTSSIWWEIDNTQHTDELSLATYGVNIDCTPPEITGYANTATCAFGSAAQIEDAFTATFGLGAAPGDAPLDEAWITFSPSGQTFYLPTPVPGPATFPAAGDAATFYGYLANDACNTLTLHLTDTECNETTEVLSNIGRDETAPSLSIANTTPTGYCYNNTSGSDHYGADYLDDYIDITSALGTNACMAATGNLVISHPGISPDYTVALDVTGYPIDDSEAAALWTWMQPALIGVNGLPVTFNVKVEDCAGNFATGSFTICVDVVAPANTVTHFDARPTHLGVWLTWSWEASAQAEEMRIYRSPLSSEYPGYSSDLWATLSNYDVTALPPAGWELVATQTAGSGTVTSAAFANNNNRGDFHQHVDGGYTYWLDAATGWVDGDGNAADYRDIYRYVTFVKDAGDNWSIDESVIVGTNADQSTNYWLGDFSTADNSGDPMSRGRVNTEDLTLLSAVYFTAVPGDYRNIGPWHYENGNIGKSLPDPDGAGMVNFSDLVPFSFNYNMVTPVGESLEYLVMPGSLHPFSTLDAEPDVILALIGSDEALGNDELLVQVVLTGNEGNVVKAVEVNVSYSADDLELIATSTGDVQTGDATLFTKISPVSGKEETIGIVAAACGGRSTILGEANLATLRFRLKSTASAPRLAVPAIHLLDNTGATIEKVGSTLDLMGDVASLPQKYALYQNYPNPFNPTTTIRFDLKDAGFVSIKVFNLLGQNVASLINNTLAAGQHQVSFDGANLSSGVYIYRLEVNGFVANRKMLLAR
ncbi:MAG: right-handed parallel beta-helix repeat-containing protein [Calditrichota bacterium]